MKIKKVDIAIGLFGLYVSAAAYMLYKRGCADEINKLVKLVQDNGDTIVTFKKGKEVIKVLFQEV